ncbi:MAG: hypothetical protein DRN90_05850 [Thermoproteota archaeon]|nr:MAG: hypothetical protein DRN90_05850 [Candidatus Korarchaeota archaeon]
MILTFFSIRAHLLVKYANSSRAIVNSGITVLLVEQHARRALSLCDMGYVMSSGRVVMKGPGSELLSDEKFIEAFLGRA